MLRYGAMSMDPGALFLSFFVSLVGFVLFRFGKKHTRPPQLVGGLVLMVFPYFLSDVIWVLIVSTVILGLVWGAVKSGY